MSINTYQSLMLETRRRKKENLFSFMKKRGHRIYIVYTASDIKRE